MAISDLMNATVGNASIGDIGKTAVDIYDVWQGGKGGKDAADTMAKGYDKGMGVLEDTYETTRQDIDPYLGAGESALEHYMGLTQDPSTIASDPAYQWRLSQGEEAVKRSLAQAGYADPLGSGANPIWLTEYAQGYASDELDRALERDLPIIGIGSDATKTGAVAGAAYGQNMAEMYTGRAKQLATKDILNAKAMSGYLEGGKGLIDSIAGNPTLLQLVKEALGGGKTEEGVPLWNMVSDAFGIDKGDVGVIENIKRMFGAGDIPISGGMGIGAVSPIASSGMGSLQFGGGDVGGMISQLTETTGIDWNNLFSLSGSEGGSGAGALDFSGLFGEASAQGGAGALEVADMGALELGGTGAVEAGGLAGFGGWAATAFGIPAAMFAISKFTKSLERGAERNRMESLMSAQDPLQKAIDYINGDDKLRGKTIGETADSSSYYSESGQTNIGADYSVRDIKDQTREGLATMVTNYKPEELVAHSNYEGVRDEVLKGFFMGGDISVYKDAIQKLYPGVPGKLLKKYTELRTQEAKFSDQDKAKLAEYKDQIRTYI